MIKRTSPVRRRSRFPVRWPVVYGGNEFIGEGTVLDLTHLGWRIAGSMPVTPGMQLSLHLSVPDKSEPIRIERATVLWVKDCEFAIESHEMTPGDQTWVHEFLNQKLGLPWISNTHDHKDSALMVETGVQADADGACTTAERSEDMMRMWIANQIFMQDIESEVIGRYVVRQGCAEENARATYRRFVQEIWQPALGIVSGMLAMKVQRELTGHNAIANN